MSCLFLARSPLHEERPVDAFFQHHRGCPRGQRRRRGHHEGPAVQHQQRRQRLSEQGNEGTQQKHMRRSKARGPGGGGASAPWPGLRCGPACTPRPRGPRTPPRSAAASSSTCPRSAGYARTRRSSASGEAQGGVWSGFLYAGDRQSRPTTRRVRTFMSTQRTGRPLMVTSSSNTQSGVLFEPCTATARVIPSESDINRNSGPPSRALPGP